MEKGKRGEMLRTPAEPRVEAGKMQEVRSSFSSMIAASTSSSTAPASGWMKEKGREVEEKEECLQGEHQLGLSRKKSH